MGGDDTEVVEKRNKLRRQIKDNLISAAASGKDLEGTLLFSSYIIDSPYFSLINFIVGTISFKAGQNTPTGLN